MSANLVAAVLMGLGAALVLLGSVGINRFPHFYARLHAAGVIDTLASGLFLLGVGVYFGPGLVSIKLLLIFVFLLFTSPTACHALARAAYISGLRHPSKTPPDTGSPS
jgi:multicomponent Na+:H+ antiporter subunit G